VIPIRTGRADRVPRHHGPAAALILATRRKPWMSSGVDCTVAVSQ
jgi:hypothetical protein